MGLLQAIYGCINKDMGIICFLTHLTDSPDSLLCLQSIGTDSQKIKSGIPMENFYNISDVLPQKRLPTA
jgi:hypothetical protein